MLSNGINESNIKGIHQKSQKKKKGLERLETFFTSYIKIATWWQTCRSIIIIFFYLNLLVSFQNHFAINHFIERTVKVSLNWKWLWVLKVIMTWLQLCQDFCALGCFVLNPHDQIICWKFTPKASFELHFLIASRSLVVGIIIMSIVGITFDSDLWEYNLFQI